MMPVLFRFRGRGGPGPLSKLASRILIGRVRTDVLRGGAGADLVGSHVPCTAWEAVPMQTYAWCATD